MTLESITKDTIKGKALVELQGLATVAVAGTTAATDIAITGLKTTDTVQSVVMFTAGVPSVLTSEATIPTAGNLQLSTTNSTGNVLVVNYFSKP